MSGDVKMSSKMSTPTVVLHQSGEEGEKMATCLNDLQNNDLVDGHEESKKKRNKKRKRKKLHGSINNKGVQVINSECNPEDSHQENADISDISEVQVCELEKKVVSTKGNPDSKEKEKSLDVASDIAVHPSLGDAESKTDEKEECASMLKFSDSEKICVCDDGNKSDVNQIMNKNDGKMVVHGDSLKDGEIVTSKRRRIENEDSTPQLLRTSPERNFCATSQRKLLILDVNGILADVVTTVPEGYKADLVIGMKFVFKRPFCEKFIQFCFQRFDLGVWSSRTKRNLDNLVDFLFGDSRHQLLFCWDQSQCTDTGCTTPGNLLKKPLFLKELSKLWEKYEMNLPWEKGYYNESNTVLLDDSPYKALRNPPNTAIFPPPFQFNDEKDDLLGTVGRLQNYLEGLAMAENSREYIKQNPFGQHPISETHPYWSFFRKIIDDGGIISIPCNDNQFDRGSKFYGRNDGFGSSGQRGRRGYYRSGRGGRFDGGNYGHR